mgnify:CR=1 FL=1
MNGMEHATYCMINVKDHKYIFHNQPEMVATETEEEYLLQLCEKYKDAANSAGGYVEHKENGKDYIDSYYYMADRGWLFIIKDSYEELFDSAITMRTNLMLLCAAILLVLGAVSVIIINRMMRPMKPIENGILALQQFDIKENDEIEKHYTRKDELGSISRATGTLIRSLRDIVQTLRECCGTLHGKADDLQNSAVELVDDMTDQTATTEQLSASLESTNDAIAHVYEEIGNINAIVESIMKEIRDSDDMSRKVKVNAMEMQSSAREAYELSAGEIGALADTSKLTATNIQQICAEANDSIDSVNNCFNDMMGYMEQSVVRQFENFASQSTDNRSAAEVIKKQLDEINIAIGQLEQSVSQIGEHIEDVHEITQQDREAIGGIVHKNEKLAVVADTIRNQAQENQNIARQLAEIVDQFEM